jgi:[ribosomal protein S5]-alanine N-acetyltransferase
MKYLLSEQETERLKFRLLIQNDFNTWIELFRDKTVGTFLGMAHLTTPQEQCEKWFELCENRYKNDLGGMNVLIDKSSHQLVGQCGLLIQDVDGVKELEIGYSILPQFQNQGYATEAAKKCRDFAFSHSFTDTLISIIHIENSKSEKVALRNGMIKTKQTIFKEMPVNIFRIHKNEWTDIVETRSGIKKI